MSKEHPYNCSCRKHTDQREYARQRRERIERGEMSPRAAKGSSPTTRNIGQKLPGSRLVEGKSGETVTVHWMPKEAEEWECPVCGRWFLKVAGEWKEPWVA